MRVADRTQSRNYLKGLNDVVYKVMQSQNRFTSELRYQNMSDNVSATSRAMRADMQINRIAQQKEGIDGARDELNSADEALKSIIEVFGDARDQTISKALNFLTGKDTGDIKMSALVGQIKNFKEEILQFTNSQFSNKYLFSGTNSADVPFKVGTDGKIMYNGIAVDSIKVNDQTGGYYYEDPITNEKVDIPQNEDVYLDVGRGIRIENGKIDPGSAFKISFSGLDILGSGTTTSESGMEMSNNVYNLLSQAQTIMEKYADPSAGAPTEQDSTRLNELYDHMKTRLDSVINNETEVGGRANFLERITNRLGDESDTLEALKVSLVGTKKEEETTVLANLNSTYKATLALGSTMFQTSLIDFLR